MTAKKPSTHQPIAASCPEAPVLLVLLASDCLLSTETAAISTGGPQDVSTWMSEYVCKKKCLNLKRFDYHDKV